MKMMLFCVSDWWDVYMWTSITCCGILALLWFYWLIRCFQENKTRCHKNLCLNQAFSNVIVIFQVTLLKDKTVYLAISMGLRLILY